MTLEKAIEISSRIVNEPYNFYTDDEKAAIKLGIEALERLKLLRSNFAELGLEMLPGETKE